MLFQLCNQFCDLPNLVVVVTHARTNSLGHSGAKVPQHPSGLMHAPYWNVVQIYPRNQFSAKVRALASTTQPTIADATSQLRRGGGDFDSAIPRFESWRPSQPVRSLRCDFQVWENRRHSRVWSAMPRLFWVSAQPSGTRSRGSWSSIRLYRSIAERSALLSPNSSPCR